MMDPTYALAGALTGFVVGVTGGGAQMPPKYFRPVFWSRLVPRYCCSLDS